jgi:hypothetical protein
MATPTFDQLTTRILRDLKDENEQFWSREDVADALNEAQVEYVEETFALRSSRPIVLKENIESYTYPTDLLRVISMQNNDGAFIDKTSSDELIRGVGTTYRENTATVPSSYYSDLDGAEQFRFYPRPSTSIETAPNNFDLEHHRMGVSSFAYAITEGDRELFVLTATDVLVFSDTDDLVARWAHGASPGLTGELPSLTYSPNTGSLFLLGADSPSKIYTIARNGTATLFGSPAAQAKRGAAAQTVFEVGQINATEHLYYMVNTDIYRTSTASFSESVFKASATLHQVATVWTGAGLVVYVAAGAAGLLDSSAADVTSGETVQGVLDVNGTVYVNHNGTLGTLNTTTGAITDTTVTGLSTDPDSSRLVGHGNYLFYVTSTGIVEYDTVNATSRTVLTTDLSASATARHMQSHYPRGMFFVILNTDQVQDVFMLSDQWGQLAYYDGDVYNQEEGAIVDRVDSTEAVFIEGSRGVVRLVANADDQVIIHYVRRPQEDLIEVEDWRALVDYAKFKLLEVPGARQDLELAGYFFSRYNKRTNREEVKAAAGYVRSPSGARSFYH